ncbi:hypothetical protein DFH08DRAFT_821745 [Mycena albidolilacea]|uniref:Uncharacterized protein n=1 Tax=Mycena albidolilacea TaxID=1033008 RepID=A0AAD6Z9L9_9AGAR|nr:hypothetical protein DFH08DRAFT_821745 [Mycena albidolilacea]
MCKVNIILLSPVLGLDTLLNLYHPTAPVDLGIRDVVTTSVFWAAHKLACTVNCVHQRQKQISNTPEGVSQPQIGTKGISTMEELIRVGDKDKPILNQVLSTVALVCFTSGSTVLPQAQTCLPGCFIATVVFKSTAPFDVLLDTIIHQHIGHLFLIPFLPTQWSFFENFNLWGQEGGTCGCIFRSQIQVDGDIRVLPFMRAPSLEFQPLFHRLVYFGYSDWMDPGNKAAPDAAYMMVRSRRAAGHKQENWETSGFQTCRELNVRSVGTCMPTSSH